MKNIFDIYRKKRTELSEPYYRDVIQLFQKKTPEIAVIIPVLNEFPTIEKTLDSLLDSWKFAQKNSAAEISATILVVVNNRKSHSVSIKNNNAQTLELLRIKQAEFSLAQLPLVPIDCASNGREIPEEQGVGFARKIGLDCAVSCCAQLLACFDADTVCDRNYFAVLSDCLPPCSRKNGEPQLFAAVTDFCHNRATDAATQNLITQYENNLINHRDQLRNCGTPYFQIALGPTIVCSALAYVSCGGMNYRLAGEDFYFLQSLIKIMPNMRISALKTIVHPAARFSDRVPFGTGDALFAAKSGKRPIQAFPEHNYKILQLWIAAVQETAQQAVLEQNDCTHILISKAAKISDKLVLFLVKNDFECVWQKLFKNTKDTTFLLRAFHGWFDGLKIIRLFHCL